MDSPRVWVIYNGPSRLQFRDCQFTGVVIGCNMAYRDWPLTDLVAIDRMTVARIRGEYPVQMPGVRCWTKKTALELPPGWQHRPSPGIDSGSLAVAVALDHPGEIVIIGADGVMGGSTDSAYDYPWHPKGPKRGIHQRHRQALVDLNRRHPGRIKIAWDHPDSELETVTIKEAISWSG